jgi:nitrile hydratase accessory protein
MSLFDAVRGEETLPRRNGELVFDAPWESRAFSVAVALAQTGRCDWEDFRRRLSAEIGAWEAEHGDDAEGWSYYERWLAALGCLVVEAGLATAGELDRRTAEATHAAAHEHDHDHDHEGAHHHA